MICRILPLLVISLLTGLIRAPAADRPDAPARPVYKSPLGLAVDDSGQHAYVALYGAGTLAVVDLRAGRVLHETPVGPEPCSVELTPTSVYVTCAGDNTLVTLDRAQRTVRRRASVEPSPQEPPQGLGHSGP